MKKYYIAAILASCFAFCGCEQNIIQVDSDACDGVTCASGQSCFKGICVGMAEVDCDSACADGFECVDGECVEKAEDGCVPACNSDEICEDGECTRIDPCEKVTCGENEACEDGKCVEIFVDPCDLANCDFGYYCENGNCISETEGEVCESDDACNDGEICVDKVCVNPCSTVTCEDGQVCTYGKCVEPCEDGTVSCVDLCEGVECGEYDECIKGQCVDKCSLLSCTDGMKCTKGACQPLCFEVECPEKQECQKTTGQCVAVIDPCENVTCANGQYCQMGVCMGDIIVEDPCKTVKCDDLSKICVNKDGEGVCVYNGDPSTNDTDGDGISDYNEGYNADNESASRDTDGDTIPDYKDSDSDGDTIPDKLEAGDGGLSQAPLDTDGDTVPDYLDKDSDGNGIPDSVEAGLDGEGNLRDTDGNGIPDYIDADNDGDGVIDVLEIAGIPAKSGTDAQGNPLRGGDCNGDGKPDAMGTAEKPWDCDGDTVPDYMDPDSDGDTIPDAYEGGAMDSSGDGFYNRYSQDSDGDTIPDKKEGRVDKNGMPMDSDGDGMFDFLDLDSDDDGLSDAIENTLCTSEVIADTDSDGDTDVIEWAAGTDPCDKNSNSTTIGNFVFMMPYNKPSSPSKRTLSFETAVQILDLYFSFDSTTSMRAEVKTLSEKLPTIISGLQCKDWGKACLENSDCAGVGGSVNVICSEAGRCITSPSYDKGCFADMYTGFGQWNNVNTFTNKLSLQKDPKATSTALANLEWGGSKEAPTQAPACASQGTAHCTNTSTISCAKSGVGCVGFRSSAIKVYIQATDADDQCGTTTQCKSYRDGTVAGNALKANNIRFMSLYSNEDSGGWTSTDSAESVAIMLGKASGSVDSKGNPFVYYAKDSDVHKMTIEGVRAIAAGMTVKITADVIDIDPGATKLIKALQVNSSGEKVQNRLCTKGIVGTGSPYQSVAALSPGKTLCYDVIPVASNTVFPPSDKPIVKRARVRVLGDGSVLNSGVAYFLIPAVYDNSAN